MREAPPDARKSRTPDSPEEIQSEIQRVREDMDATIGEIEERLRPGRIARQARHKVNERMARAVEMGESATRSAIRRVQERPALGLIALAGLTFVLARIMTGRDNHRIQVQSAG